MKTVDIHTHLLNPNVRFDRLFDKITIRFFAKSLGLSPASLKSAPFEAYLEAMARSIEQSRYVEKTCL
ncbi:mannonate dehydratase, partial [Pseudomonadota bacterium]